MTIDHVDMFMVCTLTLRAEHDSHRKDSGADSEVVTKTGRDQLQRVPAAHNWSRSRDHDDALIANVNDVSDAPSVLYMSFRPMRPVLREAIL